MTDKEELQKLRDYIKKHYDKSAGAKTSLWSHGNSDDVFSDGDDYGRSWALYRVASLIGMEVDEPDEQGFG